ncbi:OLC1v1006818C1 [Oldenlandia corymbosa var. corymbosa]|uniref:OLC1v1006818C1 n=1 Tax=Oldenlandia corymbosa var. corymbosa TaxID=529605 RepID=A0AAV1DI01_OLDCO|nr:OLC1v1006818C1 [Oldenlandia corymbosa var. corymbosa]
MPTKAKRPTPEDPLSLEEVRTLRRRLRILRENEVFYRGGYEEGTTTHGFIFNNEWVMVALDHSSGEVPPANVMELNSHLLCSFSGGSEASRGYLLDHLPDKCRKLELKEGRKASAAEASEWLAEFLSLHPDSDCSFSLGILIAGWGNESGPGLYKVKGNGKRLKVTDSWAGTGCAANLAVIIDSTDRTIKDITVEKSAELAKRTLSMAVYHAHECRECVSGKFPST